MHPTRSSVFALSALTCLAAFAALSGCDDTSAPIEQVDDGEPRLLYTDPAYSEVYAPCTWNQAFAGTPTTIRYPADSTCDAALPDSPLVVLLHGAGYGYDTYTYLLEHLAKNGFIAVSIDILASSDDDPPAHNDAATQAEAVLSDLLATWDHADAIDPTRLAIIGHSRGGRTARHLADLLKGNADAWTVRAIVGLASKGEPDKPIDGDMTTGLLLLHGALDADQRPNLSFERYDLTGSENSVAFADPNAIYKAMKLLEGGDHAGFASTNGVVLAQAKVTRGYVLAFLAAHLRGNMAWYEPYIRGDAVPHGWSAGEVVGQVSDGFLRTVVDHFQDGMLTFPTIGGAVSYSPGLTASVVATGGDVQHETYALRLTNGSNGESVSWTFPPFDADEYKWLSLRIGQTSGTAASLGVAIRNGNVWTTPVLISDHGKIPLPMLMSPPASEGNLPLVFDHMGTVRIPLSVFGAHGAVDGVRFVFNVKSAGKDYLIDSVEFAEWIHKP